MGKFSVSRSIHDFSVYPATQNNLTDTYTDTRKAPISKGPRQLTAVIARRISLRDAASGNGGERK
jgi:hypothetical protein